MYIVLLWQSFSHWLLWKWPLTWRPSPCAWHYFLWWWTFIQGNTKIPTCMYKICSRQNLDISSSLVTLFLLRCLRSPSSFASCDTIPRLISTRFLWPQTLMNQPEFNMENNTIQWRTLLLSFSQTSKCNLDIWPNDRVHLRDTIGRKCIITCKTGKILEVCNI